MWTWTVLILLATLTAGYAGIILYLRANLREVQPGNSPRRPFISVILPVRNEGPQISSCLLSLLAQDYQEDKYEIIVVDDSSSDDTAPLVTSFQSEKVRLLTSEWDRRTASPKKAAIAAGIGGARGEIIVTTDADCVFSRRWLSSLAAEFREDTVMVAGWVCIDPDHEQGLFAKIQSLELLGMVAAGAACIRLHRPLIANGANLAYRRTAFDVVSGFNGLDRWVSGDDVLLMQKLAQLSKKGVRFCQAWGAIVRTLPQRSLWEFIGQRLRWSSKVRAFSSLTTRFLLCITYLYYALLTAALLTSVGSPHLTIAPLAALVVKTLSDGILLYRACSLVGRKDLLPFLPAAEIFHILYVLLVAPCGLTGRFSWKGRRYNKNGPLPEP